MGAYVAELIILIAVFAGAYLLLRPLRERIEMRLRRWLDRNAPNGRRTTINVHPIRPTPPPSPPKDDKE